LDYRLEKIIELEPYVQETQKIVGDNYETLKELDFKGELPDIRPKKQIEKKKLEAEVIAFTLIVVLSLGFASLKVLSVMQMTTTGFSALPTGEIAGINLEMFYLVIASMILSIYILGKLMKKW